MHVFVSLDSEIKDRSVFFAIITITVCNRNEIFSVRCEMNL